MKIPAPMMPPITAMVVPNRPRWRARPLPGEDGALGISRELTFDSLCSAHLREFVKIFDVRMRAVGMAESEVSGGQTKRLAGEDVTRPGACQARKDHGVDAVVLVYGRGGANDGGVAGRGSGVVAAGHVHVDIAETFFREMGFEQGERFGGGHVGNEAQVELGDRFSGKNRFAAGTRAPADQPLDVHRGA